MKELKKQLLVIWNALNPRQKLGVSGFISFLFICFCYLIFSSHPNFMSLYPKGRLSMSDLEEVRHYLDQQQIAWEEKEDGEIFVTADKASNIRTSLAKLGIPKQATGKGFELFDTNSWIKGDKELRVLQIRALKGQLQQDLAQFENIKNAHVILNLPGTKTFGKEQTDAKASVILTLMPNASLSPTEIQAISYHLCGAVKGLKPNMIAISDTKGRLYQAIDPEGITFSIGMELLLEEHLKDKIRPLLHALLGENPFVVSVVAKLKASTPSLASIYGALDKVDVLVFLEDTSLQTKLEEQIYTLLQPICPSTTIKIEQTHFFSEKEQSAPIKLHLVFLCLGLFAVLSLLAAGLFFYKKKQKKDFSQREPDFPSESGSLESILAKLQSKTLQSLLCEEDPESLALFFADLEKSKAEKIIASLPYDLQQKILKALLKVRA